MGRQQNVGLHFTLSPFSPRLACVVTKAGGSADLQGTAINVSWPHFAGEFKTDHTGNSMSFSFSNCVWESSMSHGVYEH